jgi:hypothetical protein
VIEDVAGLEILLAMGILGRALLGFGIEGIHLGKGQDM